MSTSETQDPQDECREKLEQWVASGRSLCAVISFGMGAPRMSFIGRLTKQGETFFIFLPVTQTDSGFIGFDFNTQMSNLQSYNIPGQGAVLIERRRNASDPSSTGGIYISLGESRPY